MMDTEGPADIPASCPECGHVTSIREAEVYQDLTCEACGVVFVVMREKVHPERRAVPAECPECGLKKMIPLVDLGFDQVCPRCRTSFVVKREKRRRRLPKALRSSEEADELFPATTGKRSSRRARWLYWLSILLVLVVIGFCFKHCDALKKVFRNRDKFDEVVDPSEGRFP